MSFAAYTGVQASAVALWQRDHVGECKCSRSSSMIPLGNMHGFLLLQLTGTAQDQLTGTAQDGLLDGGNEALMATKPQN